MHAQLASGSGQEKQGVCRGAAWDAAAQVNSLHINETGAGALGAEHSPLPQEKAVAGGRGRRRAAALLCPRSAVKMVAWYTGKLTCSVPLPSGLDGVGDRLQAIVHIAAGGMGAGSRHEGRVTLAGRAAQAATSCTARAPPQRHTQRCAVAVLRAGGLRKQVPPPTHTQSSLHRHQRALAPHRAARACAAFTPPPTHHPTESA